MNTRILQIVGIGIGIISGSFYLRYQDKIHPFGVEEHITRSQDQYFKEVQPIFNAKCVACHSCYNSPCQLDLTSVEGIIRGASKKNLYDFPDLNTDVQTRLGIDARSETEWREKGFWSVTHRRNEDKSILDLVLAPVDQKIYKNYTYEPDVARACTSLDDDLRYFHKYPKGHMPYGFPDLTFQEYKTITSWLDKGAPDPSRSDMDKLRSSTFEEGPAILAEWEAYLNEKVYKSRLRSRYIFEHLAFSLITFDQLKGEKYRLVRAENELGFPVEIPTRRPFDDPRKNFFYRFQKSIRTVMDKSNLPYHLNPAKKKRWIELFDNQKLLDTNEVFPEYGNKGSNAFATFKQIHPRIRYQFLLDDAYYHIMTFIKGPVCRGKTALSVINDHFWVMFRSPDDKTLDDIELQKVFEKKMNPPASMNSRLEKFDQFKAGFWDSLRTKYASMKKLKVEMDPELIWDGGEEKNDSALLTIFRHNDSAEVLKGAIGDYPQTVWLMDYQIFEDVYYNLVAGYDVFSPYVHQVNTRLYMEISRIASEDLFLTLIKPEKRQNLRATWNIEIPERKKSLGVKVTEFFAGKVSYKMKFKYPFLGEDIKSVGNAESIPEGLDKVIKSRFAKQGFRINDEYNRSRKLPFTAQTGSFVSFFPDVSILMIDGKFFTLIRNKYHYNVSMLFFEDERLDPSKDTLELVQGVAGSYPNIYFIVNHDLNKFSEKLRRIDSQKSYEAFQKEYGVSRHDENFWEKNEIFYRSAMGLHEDDGGRFDLSRYGQF